ncbi:hypothetical protein [Hyphomonas sp.]|uniref:hypothetical protein n=1 Tax=Hyphomonas sp. TaxID=87 RepID=UPI0025C0971E|nr:hypothetical protein [Hyphomonas sp.]
MLVDTRIHRQSQGRASLPGGMGHLASICTVFLLANMAGGLAHADATSSVPEQFRSDTYIEADYEDFCSSQSSGRECIEVTIRNSSRATLDPVNDTKQGSVTGSGALDGFQVFEFPGCIDRGDLPQHLKKSVPADGQFTRRMREEKLHYWRPAREKTIKVLRGCTYAVAVKRKIGDHKWHLSYIPASAKTGCKLNYKYVTQDADLASYERWATFGAIGGDIATITGILGVGSTTTIVATTNTLSNGVDTFGVAFSDGAAAGIEAATTAGVYLAAAVVAYEAGLWGAFAGQELVDKIDGHRDFTLNKDC